MLLVLEDKAKADLSGASRKKADKLRTKINRDLVGLNTIITGNKQSTFVKYFVKYLFPFNHVEVIKAYAIYIYIFS